MVYIFSVAATLTCNNELDLVVSRRRLPEVHPAAVVRLVRQLHGVDDQSRRLGHRPEVRAPTQRLLVVPVVVLQVFFAQIVAEK